MEALNFPEVDYFLDTFQLLDPDDEGEFICAVSINKAGRIERLILQQQLAVSINHNPGLFHYVSFLYPVPLPLPGCLSNRYQSYLHTSGGEGV